MPLVRSGELSARRTTDECRRADAVVRDRVTHGAEGLGDPELDATDVFGWVQVRAALRRALDRGQLEQTRHAAARRAPHEEHVATARDDEHVEFDFERGAARLRARQFGLATRRASSAAPRERTRVAARALRRANGRAELHHRLVPLAGAGFGDQAAGERPELAFEQLRTERRVEFEKSREHPRDVAVDQRLGRIERDRQDGAGGVRTDAGQLAHERGLAWELAAVTLDQRLCRRVKVSRATVVPEPAPRPENVVLARGRERASVRKTRDEAPPVLDHRLDARLLEHRFADPDRVRIARATPRQVAMRDGVPRDELAPQRADLGGGELDRHRRSVRPSPLSIAAPRRSTLVGRMNARLSSFALGAVVGVAASLARAPLAGSLFEGPVAAPLRSGVWRATPFLALAIGLLLTRRPAVPRPVVCVTGGAVGFALHALFLAPAVEVTSPLGLGLVGAAVLLAVGYFAREAAPATTQPVEATVSGAAHAAPAPTRPPSGLRVAGLVFAAACATIALEVASRPLRQFGSSADEQTLFALAFAACLAVGAGAFAGLFAGERGRGALPALLVAATVGVWLSLATLSEIRTRDGLDAFLRTALFGLVKLDLSRRGMLDADVLIGARVLVVPAFAWGAAFACVRHAHELAGVALGIALGLVAGPSLAASGGVIDGEALAVAAKDALEPLALVAAAAAALALLLERRWIAGAAAVALGVGAWFLPARSTVVITPWDRFPAQPSLWVDHPLGLFTVEPTADQENVVTLDRRRITAVGAAAKAEESQVATMWRALALPNQGVRVLLVGQLSPRRAQILGAFGAASIDRTGAWHAAMAPLEDALFEGAPKPAGEILSPSAALVRPPKSWDLVWMPATESGVFDVPTAAANVDPTVVWQPFDAWVADRELAAGAPWSPDVLVAGFGLDRLAFGSFAGASQPDRTRGVEWFAASARIAPPNLWTRSRARGFQREFDAQTAAAKRLAASAPGSKLPAALQRYFELQVRSSPFETEAQRIELDVETLDRFRDAALDAEPGIFLRNVWDGLARVLVEKREVNWILSHVEPLAGRYPGWAALERALAAAYVEALDPATAAEHFERAIAAEPFDLTLYAPCAEAWIRAERPERAVDRMREALEIQPRRREWERLLGIALVRAGDRSGRELLQTLLLEDPDDEMLLPYLGEPPFPEYQPPAPAGEPHDEHDH